MGEINSIMLPTQSYFEESYLLGYKAWKSTHVLTEHQLTFTRLQTTTSQKKKTLLSHWLRYNTRHIPSQQTDVLKRKSILNYTFYKKRNVITVLN
jgi:hypothetical protein